jgi:hypothetical protein
MIIRTPTGLIHRLDDTDDDAERKRRNDDRRSGRHTGVCARIVALGRRRHLSSRIVAEVMDMSPNTACGLLRYLESAGKLVRVGKGQSSGASRRKPILWRTV